MSEIVTESQNIITIRIGRFQLQFSKITREGGIDLLREVLMNIFKKDKDNAKDA
jgi:hypothetical protein